MMAPPRRGDLSWPDAEADPGVTVAQVPVLFWPQPALCARKAQKFDAMQRHRRRARGARARPLVLPCERHRLAARRRSMPAFLRASMTRPGNLDHMPSRYQVPCEKEGT